MDGKKTRPNLFFRLQEWLGLALFTVMCVLMTLQLMSRYVFSSPLLFTEEFSRLCYVWVAFLGLAVAHRRQDHIRIDLFVNMLPPVARKTLGAAVQALGVVILGYLGYWGVEYMVFNQWNLAASVDFPLYYVYAAMPIGCALGIINIACGFLRQPQPVE